MAECKKRILAVVGPTASGKTALGVGLCRALNGEVISCDSMQIYRGMTIATAAPTPEETGEIPHHLVGFVDPGEDFSAARYCELAKKTADDILSRGKLPVIVGGTGLYFNAFSQNVTFPEECGDPEIRAVLNKRAVEEGGEVLLKELFEIDPDTAGKLHVNDTVRIVRALEVYYGTGRTISEARRLSHAEEPEFSPVVIGLDARDRSFLYDRINRRVDMMMENGLLEEAKAFFESDRGHTAVQAIGYKELKPYLDGEAGLEECVERLKQSTRRYAKRQLTWFRKTENIRFLMIDDYASFEDLLKEALQIAKEGLGIEHQQFVCS